MYLIQNDQIAFISDHLELIFCLAKGDIKSFKSGLGMRCVAQLQSDCPACLRPWVLLPAPKMKGERKNNKSVLNIKYTLSQITNFDHSQCSPNTWACLHFHPFQEYPIEVEIRWDSSFVSVSLTCGLHKAWAEFYLKIMVEMVISTQKRKRERAKNLQDWS